MPDISRIGKFTAFKEWRKKYGDVFGYYNAGTPVLAVSDPDIVKEILVKQFDKFDERYGTIDTSEHKYATLAEIKGEKWKRVRGITSPTFSTKKMKLMSPMILQCISKLMDRFKKRVKEGKNFNIAADFKCLTLDVIATTVFSYDTNVFNTTDNIFIKKLEHLIAGFDFDKQPFGDKMKLLMLTVFPSLMKTGLFDAWEDDMWFLDLAKKMIQDRQTSGEERHDYLHLMLSLHEKRVSGHDTDTDVSDNEIGQELRRNAKTKFLTMEEMQAQIYVFLVAGYETTSTTLAFVAYYLALYPEIQSKLQQEVDEHFPVKGQNINYDTVQKLPYLDMVFHEVSRLAYIGEIAVARVAQETTSIKGITIPKGAGIAINVGEIHRNPDLWGPEPVDQFVPERFLPERKESRHPMAYLAFGGGPRICVGMRFAIMEAKMALIHMMQKFTVNKCDQTAVPLKCNKDGIRAPEEGVYVTLSHRQ